MWMMSVPSATCAVSGMPSRADAAATLRCANGGARLREVGRHRLAEAEARAPRRR